MKNRIALLATTLFAMLLPALAHAAPAVEAAAGKPSGDTYAIAVLIGMGIAAFGCGMGQGRAASGALEGICRNPGAADRVFTPMLISLAFIETLVIFTFVSAFIVGAYGG